MATYMPLLAEAANSLTLAVVAASDIPVLLLDDNLILVAASASFCEAFYVEPSSVPGRELATLGAGAWDVPQLKSLLTATANGRAEVAAYEMDLKLTVAQTRRVVIKAHKLDYADADHIRVLVSVLDVTDARLAERHKDDLLREKAILLQELQHRIANSLQIIASILLQSARRADSDGTRSHLYDAHNRVMSVAALQDQLTASRLGDVELRAYLPELCRSIAASMIHDPQQLSLEVTVDGSVTKANISLSLGLIVTELVINALKHAFPGRRPGKIIVDYRSNPTSWTCARLCQGGQARSGPGAPVPYSSAPDSLAPADTRICPWSPTSVPTAVAPE